MFWGSGAESSEGAKKVARPRLGDQRISLGRGGRSSRANLARPRGRRTDPDGRPTRRATDDAGSGEFVPSRCDEKIHKYTHR